MLIEGFLSRSSVLQTRIMQQMDTKTKRSKNDITGTHGPAVQGRVDARRMKLMRYFAATNRQKDQSQTNSMWRRLLSAGYNFLGLSQMACLNLPHIMLLINPRLFL